MQFGVINAPAHFTIRWLLFRCLYIHLSFIHPHTGYMNNRTIANQTEQNVTPFRTKPKSYKFFLLLFQSNSVLPLEIVLYLISDRVRSSCDPIFFFLIYLLNT